MFGDENCRYKNNRVFENNKLVAVKAENYSNSVFDYSKIYGESEILLEKKSKIRKSFNLLNFRIKYEFNNNFKQLFDKLNKKVKFDSWELIKQ